MVSLVGQTTPGGYLVGIPEYAPFAPPLDVWVTPGSGRQLSVGSSLTHHARNHLYEGAHNEAEHHERQSTDDASPNADEKLDCQLSSQEDVPEKAAKETES